jgi:DNA primase
LGREGREAREYLKGRGFDAELCARFGIGYAPRNEEGRGYTWTIDKLKADGFTLDEMVAAGLARGGEEGRRAIDTFRDRVTFEIADPAGKIIAFGARALKKDEKAKYINSPECALFHKGRTLYRLKQAREIASKSRAAGLVVCEGYLDVIAFERAGIGAVAPMGTSLTEEQLQLVWRSGGEPVLCFDGDEAGQRAAGRALDLALPQLGPGRTVKIAHAPQGEDPDDIFSRAGAEALKALLAAAAPASDALFEREKNRRPLTTPEARAAFKTALRDAANRIADPDTKRLYFSDLMARADAAVRSERSAFQPSPQQPGGFRRGPAAPAPPTPELRARAAAAPARPAAESFLCAATDHPGVLVRFSEWIERLAIEDPELAHIRAALITLLETSEEPQTIDREALSLHLSRSGQERAAARLSRWPRRRPPGDADVEAEWLAKAAREVVLPAIREELDELRAQAGRGDDAAFARFQALSREARAIEARAREVKTEDEAPVEAADLGAP